MTLVVTVSEIMAATTVPYCLVFDWWQFDRKMTNQTKTLKVLEQKQGLEK